MQQAFWLARKELKYNWVGLLFTILMTIFFATLSATLLEQAARHLFGSDVTFYNKVLIDIMFVAMTPCLGAIFMSRPYLNFETVKEDPFSKRMAFYRTLPIPVATLGLSRTLFSLITLGILSIVFYGTIAIFASFTLYQYISPVEFIIFIFVWFGYALALSGINPFIEYGTNGKMLHLSPLFILAIFVIVLLSFYSYVGYGIVEWVLLLIRDYGWMIAFISFLIGISGCYLWSKLLTVRLKKRDYM